jgi:hypothetical protein
VVAATTNQRNEAMSYNDIIQSSVAAEFDAYCEGREYCRLPKGHPVYRHPIIEQRYSSVTVNMAEWLRKH